MLETVWLPQLLVVVVAFEERHERRPEGHHKITFLRQLLPAPQANKAFRQLLG